MEKGKRMNLRRLEGMARSAGAGKRKNTGKKVTGEGSNANLPWVERNFPSDVDELFVHKKKVDEVRQWITTALNARTISIHQTKMCVLSGPSGSGKTATVGVLSKELECEIKEWINPMNLNDYNEHGCHGDDVYGRSQTDLFSDFLLRSSQYSALPLKGTHSQAKRIVVVEDFPNTFFRDPPVFHSLLRNYQLQGTVPLIFIVPDGNQLGHAKLFPKEIVQELHIHSVSFNAVAPTLMKRFLSIVCQRENVSVQPSVLEGICIGSSGDVRCAINMLHFRVMEQNAPSKDQQGFKRPQPVSRKGGKGLSVQNDQLLRQDDTLMLFHALGKVLYNKRDRTLKSSVEDDLIEELSHERRIHPPESDPDEFLGKIEVSTETFVNFLHQNYSFFFGDIETCAKAARFLSDAEVVLSRWVEGDHSGSSFHTYKAQDVRQQVAVSVAVRGIMHSNTSVKSSQYRPLRKPLFGDIRTKVQKNEERFRSAFDSHPILSSSFTEIVPLLAKLPGSSRLSADQQSVVRTLGLFKGSRVPQNCEISRNYKMSDQTELELGLDDADETGATVPNVGMVNAGVKVARLETPDEPEAASEEDFRIDEFED